MYLDTLKISSVEENSEQVTARGGRGNPELMAWDHSKSITVTLEDALYTPASQSLMWGGKFGINHAKIYGAWNPIQYPKDKNGAPIYVLKLIAQPLKEDYQDSPDRFGIFYPKNYGEDGYPTTLLEDVYYKVNEEDGVSYYINPSEITYENGWFPFISWEDNKLKYVKYRDNYHSFYKYRYDQEKIDPPVKQLKNLCGEVIFEDGQPVEGYFADSLLSGGKWETGRPEIAEIIIDNYGDYEYKYFRKKDFASSSDYKQSKMILFPCQDMIGYYWKNVDMKILCLEGNKEVYTLKNAAFQYKTAVGSSNKIVTVSQLTPYITKYINEEWVVQNEASGWIDPQVNQEKEKSITYQLDNFQSKIDVYTEIECSLPDKLTQEAIADAEEVNLIPEPLDQEEKKKYVSRIKLGTFYIIFDWNVDSFQSNNSPYSLEQGFEKSQFIENMEELCAKKTFAINVDANIYHDNLKNIKKYDQSALTVFYDPKTMRPYEANSSRFVSENGNVITGNLRIIKEGEVFLKWMRVKAPINRSIGYSIIVDAEHFPGVYKLVGETYTKNRVTQKNEHFQFELPLAKMDAENKIVLQAEGDPTTFTMKLKALKKEDGTLIKLTTYSTECDIEGNEKVIPTDSIENPSIQTLYDQSEKMHIEMIEPQEGTEYEVSKDNSSKEITPKVILVTDKYLRKTNFDQATLNKIGDTFSFATTTTTNLVPGEDYTIDIINEREEAGGDN